MNNYDDIINLKRPISKTRKPMDIKKRAFQFMPFQALTGYEDSINEANREIDKQIFLSDDEKLALNTKIQMIKQNIKNEPLITVTYFIKDPYKSGGYYKTFTGIIRTLDEVNKKLIFLDKKVIDIKDIINIDINLNM